MQEQVKYYGPVAEASAEDRSSFIWRTYSHVVGGILAFAAVEVYLFKSGIAMQIAAPMVNSWLLVLGAFMLIGGAAGDRFGLRRVFTAGVAVFGIGSLAAALSPSLAWLLPARALQGLGGALLVPASLALVSTHFAPDERGRAIGTWASASASASAPC